MLQSLQRLSSSISMLCVGTKVGARKIKTSSTTWMPYEHILSDDELLVRHTTHQLALSHHLHSPFFPSLLYRHPEKSSRPSFLTLCDDLNDESLLQLRNEENDCHPQANLLGGPLEAGKFLYADLQKKYQQVD